MFKVGERVRLIHEYDEQDMQIGWYPPLGTCGTVRQMGENMVFVHWDSGTIEPGTWWCDVDYLTTEPMTTYERMKLMSKTEMQDFLHKTFMPTSGEQGLLNLAILLDSTENDAVD